MGWAESTKWVNARKCKPSDSSQNGEGWYQKAMDDQVKLQQATSQNSWGSPGSKM